MAGMRRRGEERRGREPGGCRREGEGAVRGGVKASVRQATVWEPGRGGHTVREGYYETGVRWCVQ